MNALRHPSTESEFAQEPEVHEPGENPWAANMAGPPIDKPRVCTASTVTAIAAFIQIEGISDSAAGLLAGVSPGTLSRWKQESEKVAIALGHARVLYEMGRLRIIREARRKDGSLDWQAQAWLLQHSSPEEYGTPSRRRKAREARESEGERTAKAGVEHSPSGQPMVVTPEQLAQLQAVRMRVLARVQAETAAKEAARQSGANVPKSPEKGDDDRSARTEAHAEGHGGHGGREESVTITPESAETHRRPAQSQCPATGPMPVDGEVSLQVPAFPPSKFHLQESRRHMA